MEHLYTIVISFAAGIGITGLYVYIRSLNDYIRSLNERIQRMEEELKGPVLLPYKSRDAIDNARAILLSAKFQTNIDNEYIDSTLKQLSDARNPNGRKAAR